METLSRWPRGTLMASLDEEARGRLLAIGERRYYEPGAILIRQGDERWQEVFLLTAPRGHGSACAKVSAALEDGTEAVLGIRVCGDLVGEMGLVRRAARSATVTACAPLWAYRIGERSLRAFLHERPETWAAMLGMIADRLEWANRRRLDFAGFEVPVRVARVLVELAERHGLLAEGGIEPGVPLSHDELGQMVGARQDAIGKALRALRQAGLIETHYRRIVIVDLDGLRRCTQTGRISQ
ncbi:Crp/Fnr family transcriptional regulator [Nonomuraea indica]|uniref:Crp/Fnr family transcriptional regulator n=1 Tax=Nonomuraea indica TaxID=1581193 RepID=UPI000C7AE270|nr:Crp/Fnr family transcriptional regulator [Nonomuraea indica]